MKKYAGILLHISSLNNSSIGTIGPEAYRFVDFLEKAHQKLWQVLPLNPTSYGDSPYQSPCTFAYNPYFISLDDLVKDGLLDSYDKSLLGEGIDYYKLFKNKVKILKTCYKNMYKVKKEYEKFIDNNRGWLTDYAVFSLLKEKNDYKPWYEWKEFKKYNKAEITHFVNHNYSKVDEIRFIQFLFYYQWNKLKKYANKKGIKIIGDIPIYVAYDSVDCWKNPQIFELDKDLKPINVAGCPPDYFSSYGQLWGNPLYRWDYLKKTDYAWWVERIKEVSKTYDIIRIDHFRAFAGYFKIPYGKDPKDGKWVKGPGVDLFNEINKHVKCEIIAENLGFLDDSVHELLHDTGYAGMNVMQFEFGPKEEFKAGYDYNNVLYSGTHDNENLLSWYKSLDKDTLARVNKTCGLRTNSKDPHLKLIDCCMKQKCKYVIIPIQDYLGLTNARMNVPSELGGNWLYQMKYDDLSKKLINTVKKITIENKRG